MKKLLMAFFAICFLSSGFSQNRKKDQEVDIISHEVQMGESIRLISKKYLVDPAEIYKLNKFAVDGISQGMVLQIPVPRKESKKEAKPQTDNAVAENEPVANESNANETIADKPVTPKPKPVAEKPKPVVEKPIAEKQAAEKPIAEKPLTEKEKPSTAVKQPVTTAKQNDDIKQIVITERKTEVNHKVVAKETLYSLARDYNVSVDDIKANNPEVAKHGLQIGQVVVFPKDKSVDVKQSTTIDETPKAEKPAHVAESTVAKSEPEPVVESTTSSAVKHKVEPKETLYSLSKKYNVTVDDIKNQNAALLKNGLQIGQVLTIKSH